MDRQTAVLKQIKEGNVKIVAIFMLPNSEDCLCFDTEIIDSVLIEEPELFIKAGDRVIFARRFLDHITRCLFCAGHAVIVDHNWNSWEERFNLDAASRTIG